MTAFWFLVYAVLISLVSGDNQEEVEENTRPETWRDSLAINNVTNLNDFISLLVTRDGQPVREEDLYLPGERKYGKRDNTRLEELLNESDVCSPRKMSVRLDLNFSIPNVVYFPECIKVERCGGCTRTPFLACVPLQKEIINKSVIKGVIFPDERKRQFEGFVTVRVERHLACHIQCTLTEEDCNPRQTFIEHACMCKCLQTTPCPNNQIWDMGLCMCRCPNQHPCCSPSETECWGCQHYFDPVECRCKIKRNMECYPQASQVEMERIRRSQQPGASSLFTAGPVAPNTTLGLPATTTTSTTPTPTTAETTRASCGHHSCPRNMIGAMNSNGLCVCQMRRRRQGNQQG